MQGAGRGEAGRPVGGESRQPAPAQVSLCHDPGSHPRTSGLAHKIDSKACVFSPKKIEWTCS